MPIVTAAQRAEDQTSRGEGGLARLILAAAAFAAAELLLGMTLGRFFDWGRAEALLFHAFRPWLCLLAAFVVSSWAWRRRTGFYVLALMLGAAAETLLVLRLGADAPWQEALRGVLGGALLFLVADALLCLGSRLGGRRGRWAAGLLLLLLLLLPGSMKPYDAILLSKDRPGAGPKPDLLLLTSLPIIWGEGGAFDPASRPAAAYAMLGREFDIRPIDVADAASLGSGGLMLVAQPRALAPAELVAIDAWVRRGGKILILTDPMLVWPSELALGDTRRPPTIGLLGPLLSHWGLGLEGPSVRSVVHEELRLGETRRRLAMAVPGRFSANGEGCAVVQSPFLARCSLGKGEALLIADADLMHDALWAGPDGSGARHARTADNPLILADLLDRLQGVRRERAAGAVQWMDKGANRTGALLVAFLPLLLAAGFGVALARR